MPLSDRERCLIYIDSDIPRHADAIILLEGDGTYRAPQAARLFHEHWAPTIVISGGVDNVAAGASPALILRQTLKDLHVPEEAIMEETTSLNTKEQAEQVLSLAQHRGWTTLLLVASHYHQYRAFLTFLQVMLRKDIHIDLINTPARDLPWFQPTPWGERRHLLDQEFERIDVYGAKQDCASFASGIAYYEQRKNMTHNQPL